MADPLGPTSAGPPGRSGERLTPNDFAAHFQAAWRTLWYVAAAVLGGRSGADDVVQEAAIVALDKLHQFQPGTNFMAWMSRIVRFTALNHARRRTEVPVETVESLVPHSSSDAFRAPLNGRGQLTPDQPDFDDAVAAALRELDDNARACLLLRTLLDMPYREIALTLDLPEGTAMSHVHRARAAMRRRLTQTHVHLTPLASQARPPIHPGQSTHD